MQEEIFGPVCAIAKFKTRDDAIRIGNNSTYGLAAAVSSNAPTLLLPSPYHTTSHHHPHYSPHTPLNAPPNAPAPFLQPAPPLPPFHNLPVPLPCVNACMEPPTNGRSLAS